MTLETARAGHGGEGLNLGASGARSDSTFAPLQAGVDHFLWRS